MTEERKSTQKERLLEHLKAFGKVDPLKAWSQLGIYRLAAVVHLLRQDGEPIVTRMKEVRNRWGEAVTVAEYELEGVLPPEPEPQPEPEPVTKNEEQGCEAARQTFGF